MNNTKLIKAHATAIHAALLTFPVKAGDVAVLFTKQRFREQAWAGFTTQPWKARKAKGKGSRGRALLVKSGRLRRSPRIIRTTRNTVTYGSSVPYARIHNEGYRGTEAVKAHTRTKWNKAQLTSANGTYEVKAHTRRMRMPVRRFMGASPVLDKQINRLLAATINNALKRS